MVQAFGLLEKFEREVYRASETTFWRADVNDPNWIVRSSNVQV